MAVSLAFVRDLKRPNADIGAQELRPVVTSRTFQAVHALFGKSGVDRTVRGDVVDLAARRTDIRQLPVTQVAQGCSQPLAAAPETLPNTSREH